MTLRKTIRMDLKFFDEEAEAVEEFNAECKSMKRSRREIIFSYIRHFVAERRKHRADDLNTSNPALDEL
ncbi:MAG: hypothetical protein KAI17_15220 [Thiotrichaceae bacterium]|nr:hypothetical protein [Thiotrichaceae bacterium]